MGDKYLYLAKKLKELSNIKVTVISILIGALETIHRILENRLEGKEIRRQADNIKHYCDRPVYGD